MNTMHIRRQSVQYTYKLKTLTWVALHHLRRSRLGEIGGGVPRSAVGDSEVESASSLWGVEVEASYGCLEGSRMPS